MSRPAPGAARRRQAGQIVLLMCIVTLVLGLVGGGLIDVAGAIEYHAFLLQVAASGAGIAASQTTTDLDSNRITIDAAAGEGLAQPVMDRWVGVNGITSATVTVSGADATGAVTGVYRPMVLAAIPGFSGFTMTARIPRHALPTG